MKAFAAGPTVLAMVLSLAGSGCTPLDEGAEPISAGASAGEPNELGAKDGGVLVTGQAPPAARGFRSVVSFLPVDPTTPDESLRKDSDESLGMDQFSREFYPDVLVTSPGHRVEFANSEEEMHNVHVRDVATEETLFNVGTPAGASYPHRFERAGIYHVTCDVHSEMEAFVVVSEGRSVAASKDGSFEISVLEPGQYRVVVWNADPDAESERTVEIDVASSPLDLTRKP